MCAHKNYMYVTRDVLSVKKNHTILSSSHNSNNNNMTWCIRCVCRKSKADGHLRERITIILAM